MIISENVQMTNSQLPDIIELRNIRQKYADSEKYIIDGLSLLIEDKPDQGQFVVLLGKSGCGKSTVLRYICGLQKPTEGEVLLYGKPRTDSDRIGMVFQQYSSFPWLSVLDNVALGLHYHGVNKKERTERAMEMIKMVGLEGHQHKFAQYPTLSGGQLQRVAIARNLIMDSRILLMDEPFGALDLNTRLAMQDLLCQIWNNLQTTVIFVTHDISEAVYLGDEVYLLRSNPAKIVRKIDIDLPLRRTKEIKRSKEFNQLVHQIEDEMLELDYQLSLQTQS